MHYILLNFIDIVYKYDSNYINRCASSNKELLDRLCGTESQYISPVTTGQTPEKEDSSNITLRTNLLNTTAVNCSLGHTAAIDPTVEFWELVFLT